MSIEPQIVLYSPHPTLRIEKAFRTLSSVRCLVSHSIDEAADLLETTGAEILVSPRWTDRCLTPSLRWIQSVASGVEAFPLEKLGERGLVLTSARYVSSEAMAEHALGLLLALALDLPRYSEQAQRREWITVAHGTLAGSVVGIVGLGAVGEAVAQRLQCLGARVIGTKRNLDNYAGAAETVLPADAITDLCHLADAIVICVPLDNETRGMIGREQLDALGGGYLVNVSRGAVVDEAAMLEALGDGRLAGAGLDVLTTEPLPPGSPWWEAPNTIITPHVAGKFHEYGQRLADLFERNLRAFLGEGDWENRVV